MNIILEALRQLREQELDEKYERYHSTFNYFLSHFSKSIKELYCILATQTFRDGNEEDKTPKGYISFSYALYRIHDREPVKYPCGVVFNKASFFGHVGQDNNLDKSQIGFFSHHDVASKIESGIKSIRVEYIKNINDIIYKLKFFTYDFKSEITITKETYEYLKPYFLQKDHTISNGDDYKEMIKLESNVNLYLSTSSKFENNKDSNVIFLPDDIENDIIYREANEFETRIRYRDRSKVHIEYHFKPSDVEEIILPTRYEKIYQEFKINPKKFPSNDDLYNILADHYNKRITTDMLKDFSDETLVLDLFRAYKRVNFIFK